MPDPGNFHMFCFTCNNFTDETLKFLKKVEKKCTWLIYGRELAPKTGTPHLQGALYLEKPSRKANMMRMFKDYWIGAPGPLKGPDHWKEYCLKQDVEGYEYGTAPTEEEFQASIPLGQGKRNDLDTFMDTTRTEKPTKEALLGSTLYMRYPRHCDKIIDFYHPPEALSTLENEWIYGPPRTGKSFGARRDNPGFYSKPCNKWWDGYTNEDVVIIDDVDPDHKWMQYHLKIWADHYPFIAESKGSSRRIRPKKIIVTSNHHPSDIFQGIDAAAIISRFRVTHVTKHSAEIGK